MPSDENSPWTRRACGASYFWELCADAIYSQICHGAVGQTAGADSPLLRRVKISKDRIIGLLSQ